MKHSTELRLLVLTAVVAVVSSIVVQQPIRGRRRCWLSCYSWWYHATRVTVGICDFMTWMSLIPPDHCGTNYRNYGVSNKILFSREVVILHRVSGCYVLHNLNSLPNSRVSVLDYDANQAVIKDGRICLKIPVTDRARLWIGREVGGSLKAKEFKLSGRFRPGQTT